ncbi:MAG: hypothetical protein ACTSQ4_12300 [Candidatus Heimdallarchaeaceae archaeon]
MTESELSLKLLYEQFIQFEEDNKLFSKQIADVFFWERVRFPAFIHILRQRIDATEPGKKAKKEKSFKIRNYFLKFRNYLLAILRTYRNPLLAKRHDIIFFSTSRRKKQEDGYWWDIYIDHLENKLGYSTILLEKDLFLKYRKPAKTENMVYLTYIDFLVDLKKYFRRSRVKFSDEEINYLSELSIKMKNLFGYSLDLTSYVRHKLTRRKRILPYYQKLLTKIKPKAVILICNYGKEDFVEACKQSNIPTIELQHGVITKYHVGYSFEKESSKKIIFPDYLFTFGEYWKDTITYPIPKQKIVNVGFPELEIRKQLYLDVKKKKQILFISQTTIGSNLSKFAVELSKNKKLGYRIKYKLHPFEVFTWKENYPWLKNSNIEIIDHQGENLFKLFAESEIQVGVYSTAIYEGLSFQLKTFLVDLVGIDIMDNLIKSGYATKISLPGDFVNILSDNKTEEFENEIFFKSDSIINIKNELKKIIGN